MTDFVIRYVTLLIGNSKEKKKRRIQIIRQEQNRNVYIHNLSSI